MSEIVFFFDLGGVLIENVGFEALKKMGDLEGCGQEMRGRWLRSPSVAAFERGELGAIDFAQGVISEFGLPMEPAAFIRLFRAWVKDFYPGARELVQRLKRRHKVGCLSNCNELHWRDEWAECFDFPLASHLTGQVKPDPPAFMEMSAASGMPLDRIIYFDDSLLNVETARALGIQAYHAVGFGEVEQWFSAGPWNDIIERRAEDLCKEA